MENQIRSAMDQQTKHELDTGMENLTHSRNTLMLFLVSMLQDKGHFLVRGAFRICLS